MSKKKQQPPTVEEIRSLREQLQGYIYDIVDEFEVQTGMRVSEIEVQHVCKIGFGEKPRLVITAHLEL